MRWIIDIIKSLMEKKFTGSLQINFFEGGISNVNKNQSIKPPKELKGHFTKGPGGA